MPHKTTTSKKANGTGSIRKITTTRNGTTYTYWQARYTVGYDMGTGKQIQRSITGKTQKEVAQKLKKATVAIDEGTYQAPCRMTLGEWLDIWQKDFLSSVKPRTRDSYRTTVEHHIKPIFAFARLDKLQTKDIQQFYNTLYEGTDSKKAVSAKTLKNTHGVLHKALQQAVELGYIRNNPANACKLPKVQRKDITPLENDEIARFINACKGDRYELIFLVTLFTGMREGEVLGLTWDCVDFHVHVLTINKQLQKERRGDGKYHLVPTKNGKSRRVVAADFVIDLLERQRKQQELWKKNAGCAWQKSDLVFTNEVGQNLSAQTVYLHFKAIAEKIGRPDARFHDLRHSYAVASLQSGDDIKTLQENLGHHTAAFTLDVYGHVTEKMRRESAANMQRFIASVAQ